jgi:hypothetical protein
MPDWLYRHLPKVIQPMITQKEKGTLVKPVVFTNTPLSFWINPQNLFSLSHNTNLTCSSCIVLALGIIISTKRVLGMSE